MSRGPAILAWLGVVLASVALVIVLWHRLDTDDLPPKIAERIEHGECRP